MTASRTRKRIVVCAIGIAVAASIVGDRTVGGVRLDRIILLGLGKVADISELEIQKIGGKIFPDE